MADDDKPFSHDDAFRRFRRAQQPIGGIKSQQRRGKPQYTWWGSRWIAVLESFDIGARMQRGRSYARRGQVLNIRLEPGKVTADVQGSERKPYHVEIRLQTLSDADWQRLGKEFSSKALYGAKLLARQMPLQIEDAFSKLGLSLFPKRHEDLKTRCSCPDWSNPCKHIAAVYYLLAEEFDRDPFLIFKLRGMDEDDLMRWLKAAPEAESRESLWSGSGFQSEFAQPISADYHKYWQALPMPADMPGDLTPPQRHALLPRSMGAFPFWRGEQDFWASLEQAYKLASTTTSRKFIDELAGNTNENDIDS
jgi:uncharacterized Zn finger protein